MQLTALQLHNNLQNIQPPTSPIQNSLTIPQGVDPTDETLKGIMNDPQISKSYLQEVFAKASSAVGTRSNPLTPQKPEDAHNDASLDTNSETSETSMVNDDQVPPSHSKIYTQHDLDKLRTYWEEQSKLQKAIDNKNLEKEIHNHYCHQIQSLKNEHQEQLATLASETTAQKDNLITADAQRAQYIHTIEMLQQRLKLLEGANQTQVNLATPPFDPLASPSLLL